MAQKKYKIKTDQGTYLISVDQPTLAEKASQFVQNPVNLVPGGTFGTPIPPVNPTMASVNPTQNPNLNPFSRPILANAQSMGENLKAKLGQAIPQATENLKAQYPSLATPINAMGKTANFIGQNAPLTPQDAVVFGGGELGLEALKGAPGVKSAADYLGAKALGATKRFRNTLPKQGMIPNAVRAAFKHDILKGTSSARDMLEATTSKLKSIGKEIGGYLDKQGFGFDNKKAISAISKLRPRGDMGQLLRGGDYDMENSEIDHAIATIKAHGNGEIKFSTANDIKGRFQESPNYAKEGKSVNAFRKKIAGTYKDLVDKSLEEHAHNLQETILPKAKPAPTVSAAPGKVMDVPPEAQNVLPNAGKNLDFNPQSPQLGTNSMLAPGQAIGDVSQGTTLPDLAQKNMVNQAPLVNPEAGAESAGPTNIPPFKELGADSAGEQPGNTRIFSYFPDEAKMADYRKFLENKQDYGGLSQAEDLLVNRTSSEEGNKMMGLTDWLSVLAGGAAYPETHSALLGPGMSLAAKKLYDKFGLQAGASMLNKLGTGSAPNFLGGTLGLGLGGSRDLINQDQDQSAPQ